MSILVYNPNSSMTVTLAIADSLKPLGEYFEVTLNVDGPATIRTDEDAYLAGNMFLSRALTSDCDGFIIACFSDPGLDQARAKLTKPITGAQEASILEATERAERYGIIALSSKAVPRHQKNIAKMGLLDRLVAELPLPDVSAAASGQDVIWPEMLTNGRDLKRQGAGAIVLGCAGMGTLAERLQAELSIPVIDPVQAAGKLALRRRNQQTNRRPV
ncbi:aspartate/glutamate racemase family protein [Roseovarius sp. 2305UL8-3]|uniref:aspartate/glutamate racemase family protein n=1 Tax=Roseovarius conchicola TaxID=3121636 RepID=UPI0035274859